MKKKIYTIFGHTGFIGSFLKKRLNKEILILPDKNKFSFKKNLGNIIYCIGSDNWINDTYNSYYANLGYIPEIIKKNKYSSFTFLSTSRIYRNLENTSESANLLINPNNLDDYYNIKKICAESFLLSQQEKIIKVIRLSNIYGFNKKTELVIPALIKSALKNKLIKIFINKKCSKDFLSIENIFPIILNIIHHGKSKIYNVASGKNISLEKIASKISLLTNCKIKYLQQKKIINEPIINIKKVQKEFNFKPSSNIIDDLPKLIDKYKKFI